MTTPLGAAIVERFIWQLKMATQRAQAILFALLQNGQCPAQLQRMTMLGLVRVEAFLRQMVKPLMEQLVE